MARRLTERGEVFHETYHLECPRCHQHNLVSHGESRYVCLNCGWTRDVSRGWVDSDIKLSLCRLFLATLPVSYKDTAKEVFWDTVESEYVENAYQYFLGGMEYRLRKVYSGVLLLGSTVLSYSFKSEESR